MKLSAASGLGAFAGAPAHAANAVPTDFFPQLPPVKRLIGVPLTKAQAWEEWTLYTCLQGLINRLEPRIFFINDEYDALWLDYYGATYGIEVSKAETRDLLERFSSEIGGYIVYDEGMMHSLNVATTMGALNNALPVAPALVPRLKEAGLRQHADLRGRWNNQYDAYEWALEELFPECTPHILAAVCVDHPHWPSDSTWVRDYAMAHRLFTCDLSASRRDRRDRALLSRVFESMTSPGWALGWRCVRCTEHEYVALASQHGISMQCGLSTLNLSVHAAMPRTGAAFTQDHATPESAGDVEKKVYVAFMNTDGDATFSMSRLHSKRFRDPEHGRLPYSWGFLPAACDLMPGVARYLYEHKHSNDYFVAPTCGAMYTYPALHPDARAYLRMTREYMTRAGLRMAYISNWDDDFWWQEIDLPEFVPVLREELPDAIGFVRGMGESAFEPHYIGGGAPYLFCGEGIHSKGDIYETIKDYVDAIPVRPLFLFCLVNHSRTLGEIVDAVQRLGDEDYRWVKLDAFMELVQNAHDQKLIGDDLDPDSEGLRRLLIEEGKAMWPGVRDTIAAHAARALLTESAFRAQVEDMGARLALDRSATAPSDIVAFDTVWDSMRLVKSALNAHAVYVNNKAEAVRKFIEYFGNMEHARVVPAWWERWMIWERAPISFGMACDAARDIEALAQELEGVME